MTKVVALPNEPLIREQAGAWIARIDRGLQPPEHVEIRRWLGQNTRHRDILFEMAQLWDRMEVLNEIAELFPLQPDAPKRRALATRPVLVSLVLILLGVAVGLRINSSRSPDHDLWAFAAKPQARTLDATYVTAVGKQQEVPLPDHSIVTLNTATLLRVHYTGVERKIELVRGEAHFQVAKHEGRVFSVRVGASEFRAVGTAFDIRVDSERGIELTVTEGRVEVRTPSGNYYASGTVNTQARDNGSEPTTTNIVVDAGREVAIGAEVQTVQNLQPEQLQAALAWKSGMIAFDGDPLEKAIREVNRYSNTQFVIAEEKTKKLPVSGYFRVGDLDGLIATLHSNFNIDATRDGDVIVLSSRQ